MLTCFLNGTLQFDATFFHIRQTIPELMLQFDSYKLKLEAEAGSNFAVTQNSASLSVTILSDVKEVSIGADPSLNSKSPSSFLTADKKNKLLAVGGNVSLPDQV